MLAWDLCGESMEMAQNNFCAKSRESATSRQLILNGFDDRLLRRKQISIPVEFCVLIGVLYENVENPPELLEGIHRYTSLTMTG